MRELDRADAILLGLLCAVRREVVRTKFVKLTFLLDNLFFEQIGETMTGFTYHWDHYGPNAVGDVITQRLSALSRRGLVRETQRLTPYENYANYYKVADSVDAAALPLSSDDWVFISAIIKKYGRLPREAVVRAAKQTPPVVNARQYEILRFVTNPKAEALKRSFAKDREFAKATKRALSSAGPSKVGIEELRAERAESVRN